MTARHGAWAHYLDSNIKSALVNAQFQKMQCPHPNCSALLDRGVGQGHKDCTSPASKKRAAESEAFGARGFVAEAVRSDCVELQHVRAMELVLVLEHCLLLGGAHFVGE